MRDRFRGQAIIVTGAGSIGPGISNGKAASILYAREGGRVLLVDRDRAAAEETERHIAEVAPPVFFSRFSRALSIGP